MAWRKSGAKRHNMILYGVAGAIFLYMAIVTLRALHTSAIFARHDRINVAFFGEEATILSFGLTDNVNYIVSLSHEQKIMIPGGYNEYPLGSLGKLVAIEKDPSILQRTFSSMTSAYVNYYVSPKKPEVYEKPDTDEPTYQKLDLITRIFSSKNMTNMNVFDKMYVGYLIAKRRQQDYVVLRGASEKSFQKKYKGFYNHQSLREEGLEVKILYHNYKSAVTLSRIIEGQGIRIVDLSPTSRVDFQNCLIRSNLTRSSQTIRFLQHAFHCSLEQGETEGVDIVLYLGKEIENLWE
jgi:hypothetical protein